MDTSLAALNSSSYFLRWQNSSDRLLYYQMCTVFLQSYSHVNPFSNDWVMGSAKVQYVRFNTSGQDLPDISALALGCCTPSGVVHIYLANPFLLCCNLHLTWYIEQGLYTNITCRKGFEIESSTESLSLHVIKETFCMLRLAFSGVSSHVIS